MAAIGEVRPRLSIAQCGIHFLGMRPVTHTMPEQFLRTIMSTGAAQALEGGTFANGAEANEPTLVGSTLESAYRIDRLIAQGGMSAVYEAVQLRLNQRVAVKVMARELASNAEALARFRREAEITSRLRHPHLVTVTDFGTAPAGQPFLVMEYLEGIDLDQRIRARGRLPLSMVVHVTKQVAAALAAAHEQGVVHRDLKPANVFLVALPGEADFAKVLDFGISKVRAASTQLTKASAIIGTPNYMAPEQATGMLDEIDHRTDQWALACIVWEMLTGRAPFASDDISAVFYQVIHLEPAPLAKKAPEVPPGVEAVLRRALSKSSVERFPSIREFAAALETAAVARPGEAGVRSPTGEGQAWVERRQGRRERRASDPTPTGTVFSDPGDAARDAAASASFGRRARRIFGLAALAIGVAAATIVLLRGEPPARAVAAPSPPLLVAPIAPARAVAPAAAPLAEPLVVAAPAPAPLPSGKSTSVASGRPVARSRGKSAEASAHGRDPGDPFASAPRSRQGAGSKQVDDGIDPFAVARPAAKHAVRKPSKRDADFVDPFAP